MSGSYEKSVKGATKIKLAAPKSKYIEHILQATHTGEAGVAEIFRTLTFRLRDSTWIIVFKALIVTHLMIREGAPQVTLGFMADSPSKLAISQFSDAQVQGGNVRRYHSYLVARAKSFQSTRVDWVREGPGRMSKQTVDKGLLRETESVQKQLSSLLKCDLFSEPENEISLTAFRLLVIDLLALFKVMNEGMVNILEHYFEMSKPDAERALNIYSTFIKQTENVVKYLHVARQFERATRLEIPTLKHAPTTLLSPLQEYLNDPDFDINRRQFLAQRDGKQIPEKSESSKPAVNNSATSSQPQSQPSKPAGPAPDLIDFFSSIEQNQQPMQTQPQSNGNGFGFQQPQQTGFPSTNPFAQMATQQQQQPQQQNFAFSPQQSFNPGQLQTIPQNQQTSFQPQQQQQHPFQTGQQQQPFQTGQQQQPFQNGQQQQFNSPPQPQQGFNNQQPFGQPQGLSSPTGQANLLPNPTGQQSTNPFRQSMMPMASGTNSSPFNQSSPFNSPPPQPQNQQSTNPFAMNIANQQGGGANPSPFFSAPPTATNSVFNQQNMQSPPPQQTQPATQPLQAAKTGTNPFAKSAPTSAMTSPLQPQATGTNPFRQSTFVNQQTGQGWQAHQGTIGGLEQLPTMPVFPRPGVNQPQQPQQQPWS